MIYSLIISLSLTLIIEIIISFALGIRNKIDIISIVFVNLLTNPLIVFIVNILRSLSNKIVLYIVILILEVLVIIVEGKIFEKVLISKRINGIKLSIINNTTSFVLGVIMTFLNIL